MAVKDVLKIVGIWAIVLCSYWVVYNIGHYHGAWDENAKLREVRCSSIDRWEDGSLTCQIRLQAEDDLILYEERQEN